KQRSPRAGCYHRLPGAEFASLSGAYASDAPTLTDQRVRRMSRMHQHAPALGKRRQPRHDLAALGVAITPCDEAIDENIAEGGEPCLNGAPLQALDAAAVLPDQRVASVLEAARLHRRAGQIGHAHWVEQIFPKDLIIPAQPALGGESA